MGTMGKIGKFWLLIAVLQMFGSEQNTTSIQVKWKYFYFIFLHWCQSSFLCFLLFANLLIFCVFGIFLGALSSYTNKTGINTSLESKQHKLVRNDDWLYRQCAFIYPTECMESREFLLFVGDLSEFHNWWRFRQRQNWSLELCSKFAFLFCGFTLAQLLLVVDREQNQSASVFFEPLDIFLNAFNRFVAATVINSDADCSCELWCNFCTLRKKHKTFDMSIYET